MVEKRGYGQFCPIALAAEVLAERWTPLVVRELLCGSVRFNDIQRGVPRMSSALLARRLKELQFAGVVERRRGASGASEYHLTPAGRELFPVVETMGLWAQRWLRHDLVDKANLDPNLLMWDIRRNVAGKLPPRDARYVVEFRLSGVPVDRRRYWLVFEQDAVDLCHRDPGFDVDLFVDSSLRTLTRVWLGHTPIREAIRDDRLRLYGSRSDIAAFRSWFVLSMFAPAGAEAAKRVEPGAK
jgi:DNA-binding HxlR family transcriptional regulator